MNSNPLVSIIIPVYNADKYLRMCIDSILAQTYQQWECILIDDGSKDNSSIICDEFSNNDLRIKVLHKSNEGVSIARNAGLDLAIGEYITFVDADDYVEPYYLEKIIEYKYFDVVFFPFTEIMSNGNNIVHKLQEVESTSDEKFWNVVNYLRNNSIYINFFGFTWNKLFRAEIIQRNKIRFIQGLKVCEDEVFTLNYCINAKTIKVLATPIYNYRIHSNSLTRSKRTAQDYILLANSLMAIVNSKPNENIKHCFIPQVASTYCQAALEENSLRNVFSILKLAANNGPVDILRG